MLVLFPAGKPGSVPIPDCRWERNQIFPQLLFDERMPEKKRLLSQLKLHKFSLNGTSSNFLVVIHGQISQSTVSKLRPSRKDLVI